MKKYLFFLIIPVIVFAQSVFNPLPTAPLSIFGIPLMQKGSLLVSDGSFLGEKLACADNQILVYDSLETDGIKCEAKPVDSNAATLCASGEYLDGDGTCKTAGGGSSVDVFTIGASLSYGIGSNSSTGSGTLNIPDFDTSITTISTKPVIITLIADFEITSSHSGGSIYQSCYFEVLRNGTPVTNQRITHRDVASASGLSSIIVAGGIIMDNVAALSIGTVVNYTFRLFKDRGNCSVLGRNQSNASIRIQQEL